jgi:hypothetical protein
MYPLKVQTGNRDAAEDMAFPGFNMNIASTSFAGVLAAHEKYHVSPEQVPGSVSTEGCC